MLLERSREGRSKGAVSYEMEKPQALNLSKAFTLHYRNIPVNWSKERSITICRTRHIVILHIYLTTRHNNMILHHNPDPTESPQHRSYGVATTPILRNRSCSPNHIYSRKRQELVWLNAKTSQQLEI